MSHIMYMIRMHIIYLEWYLVDMLRKYRKTDSWRKLVRTYKMRKLVEGVDIPSWWDITVDCGWSDKWYRCHNCDTCLHHRNTYPF